MFRRFMIKNQGTRLQEEGSSELLGSGAAVTADVFFFGGGWVGLEVLIKRG